MNLSRPRPVLTAVGISGLITSVAGVLTWLGYVGPAAHLSAMADTIGAIVVGAVTLGSHLLAGVSAQSKVTPVDRPQANDGTPLVKQTFTAAVSSTPGEVTTVEDIPDAPADPAPAAQ